MYTFIDINFDFKGTMTKNRFPQGYQKVFT